ncbi:MAG TPA: pseudouridine synthase [Chloroflexota bacterium]|nr:pseudouridine synthase [Chloroflexota bacterium]
METEKPKGERLQKVLAAAGVASRRAAEEMIRAGRVTVNGKPMTELGVRVLPRDRIAVDGYPLGRTPQFRYILFNKPVGVISSALDELGRQTVLDVVQVPERVYPVGRLDRDSEGLMLLTNDGELTNRLLHPSHEIPREYRVWVSPSPTEAQLEQLRRGVVIEGGLTYPAQVARRPGEALSMIIREGRKRQIRQMAEAVGLRVNRLQRVRMGSLGLGTLRPGEWRDLGPGEVRALAEAVGLSRGMPK